MPEYGQFQTLQITQEEQLLTVVLNRPDALNAVSPQLHRELEDFFSLVNQDDQVGAIILTGAGRAFSAGGDVKGMAERAQHPDLMDIMRTLAGARHLILTMLEVQQPIIAAVNGDAVGLGATIALFCDIVLASETARIGDPHVQVGLVAGDGGAIIWPLLVGVNRAKEFLMTGRLLPAAEAERLGLVNRVVPAEDLHPAAREVAQELLGRPTWAVRWSKASINKTLRDRANLILDTSLALEGLSFLTEDHKEATTAFVERRRPHFTGR
ncbi:MAG: enoyl-CoA hydratase/isomerase family protein [Chloroflexi bacterium]|nr:enoyl-CoA hydratase/isomerase family protein [Chloroflexota bacterium]